jgi:hypothetical protein
MLPAIGGFLPSKTLMGMVRPGAPFETPYD